MPEGFHTITPRLTVSDAEAAIALYRRAFNAEVKAKMHAQGGKKIMHSCLQIGSSRIFVQDEMPDMPGLKHRGASFYLYVANIDAQHKHAVAAGLTEVFPPTGMFWGDRTSVLTCPFGNRWTLATHIRNPSEAGMAEAMKEWAAKGKAH